MLFYAWQASGDPWGPYKMFNGLDDTFRPVGQPDAEPRPPRFPSRVRAFIYACGMYARELARKDSAEQAQLIGKVIGQMMR